MATGKRARWRDQLFTIIFGHETRLGRLFDIILLAGILISILVVMLESVEAYRESYGVELRQIEWFFTLLFSVELILRLISAHRPWRYAYSFYGLIDIVSIMPTYISLYFDGAQSLLIIRTLRLLRVFRILKLSRFISEANTLITALISARAKIIVFFWAVLSMVLILGTLMYLIEGPENGFTSIPRSIYWAIVTMTTVGYGDVTPQTTLGQFLASFVMILGYAIIAVPTGIVTAEITNLQKPQNSPICHKCHLPQHLSNANFCPHCGADTVET